MILYHGTSENKIGSILKNGLVRGKKSSFNSEYRIGAWRFIYLSIGYAPFFAELGLRSNFGNPVVFEVDVNKNNLLADIDYFRNIYFGFYKEERLNELKNIIGTQSYKRAMIVINNVLEYSDVFYFNELEFTVVVRDMIYDYPETSLDSLHHFGSCFYDGKSISPSRIKRYVVLNYDKLSKRIDKIGYVGNMGIDFYSVYRREMNIMAKKDIWKPPLAKEVIYL